MVCNYWASHAGTEMWSDWRPEIIREDFMKLSQAGLQVVRIFPLWPDFQPLKKLYGVFGRFVELRIGEQPLPDTEAGRAGIDTIMLERFRCVADLADECGLKLVVGLVTGWMSGRMFAPPAFESLNLLTDPLVIRWQVKMVRHIVRKMKYHSAIVAWSVGNECNCMAPADRDQAWLWTNTISAAIRAEDDTRQLTSGMHGMSPNVDDKTKWTIQDQAELTDILTTHPYPLFTSHSNRDPINHFRNCFHAAAESRFYSDIGKKNCLAEELGTLSTMFAGEKEKAAYIRNTLYNIWSHDCLGLLWWCGFEQIHLEKAPYDWNAVERELGLFDGNGCPKPVLAEFSRFRQVMEKMAIDKLPQFSRQAVCILSAEQDTWGNAWSSFLLAKQAGFDIEFQDTSEPIRESELYLMPGINGARSISRGRWLELLERVKAGATLYVSLDADGLLSPFDQIFGVEPQSRSQRTAPVKWEFDHEHFQTTTSTRYQLRPDTATVLAWESDGTPVFMTNKYGEGKIYLLTVPLERYMAETPKLFPDAATLPHYKIYQKLASPWITQRLVRSANPIVTVTEHMFNDNEAIAIMVNNQPETIKCLPDINPVWQISRMLHGELDDRSIEINGNDAVVLHLIRK